jgi:hypothetical protein
MRRDPLREQRIAEDPAGEGARALEPVLEWYAAYKHFWRTHPDAVQIAAQARLWLSTRLKSALNVEDAMDPVTPGKSTRRR